MRFKGVILKDRNMSIRKLTCFLLLLTAVSSVWGEAVSNDLRCYYCESEQTDACEDPVDTSIITSAVCRSLQYKPKRRYDDEYQAQNTLIGSVDGKLRGIPLLNKIFESNATNLESLFKYVCIKVEFTKDDVSSITRTCERVGKDIENVCDVTKQKVDSRVQVTNCEYCEFDNCNSSGCLGLNWFIGIISIGYFSISKILLNHL